MGRGARSVELDSGGCGGWTIANVDGDLELGVGGSGSIRAGTSRTLDASVGGSGSVSAGGTGDLAEAAGYLINIDTALGPEAHLYFPTFDFAHQHADIVAPAQEGADLRTDLGHGGAFSK